MGIYNYITKNMSDEVEKIRELVNDESKLKEFSDEAFDQLDDDGSGFLEPTEIKQVLEQFGSSPTDEQLNDVVRDLDKDNNGKIDKEEFMMLFKNVLTMMLAEMEG